MHIMYICQQFSGMILTRISAKIARHHGMGGHFAVYAIAREAPLGLEAQKPRHAKRGALYFYIFLPI
jgi:hypothetical protein